MDERHHLLNLFEKLHEKYNIQDGEYKEFVEALGGKMRNDIDTSDWKYVKVVYDLIEISTEFCEDEWYPTVNIRKDCSRIWAIVEDEHPYQAYGNISNSYMHKHEIDRSVIPRLYNDAVNGKYVEMIFDSTVNRKYCLRIKSVEKVG